MSKRVDIKLSFETSSSKQKEAAIAWADPTVKDIVYGGAKGGGKSWLGASLIFASALTYPGTRYFIARKNLNDLVKHTIPTINKVFSEWNVSEICKRYKIDRNMIDPNHESYSKEYTDKWRLKLQERIILLEDFCTFNGQKNSYNFHNGSTVLLIYAKEIPSDPLYERFGSMEMTQGWIEEAGEFDKNAMLNLSISIGRHMNDIYGLTGKLLQTCNPKKNYLYTDYYIPWKNGTLPRDKRFIQAFAHENKKQQSGYLERLKANLQGVAKDRLLDGNWEYITDSDALIDYDKICDIFSNDGVLPGERFVSCDIARLGGDRIVMIEWNGWRGKVYELPKGPLNQTAAYIEAARSRIICGKSNTIIDADGIGAGVADFAGYVSFHNGGQPLQDPMKPFNEDGKPNHEYFDYLKSQCYFRLADRINKNGIYLECESEEQEDLIKQELQQVRQKELDNDKKKGVVPKNKVKEAIGRSPDFADTIMMREYFELKPVQTFRDATY